MDKNGNQRLLCLVVLALFELAPLNSALMNTAMASPPIKQKPALPLDLRPSLASYSVDKTSAFPSALHRQIFAAQEDLQLPLLGVDTPRARIPGRVEEFARRVRREGLPVARLWENKSALVSLGLNQKGKPGLWIIQKIH